MPIRFHGGFCSRRVALGLVAVLVGQTILAAALIREPNSTLALPLEPYEYTTVEAFPGLVFDQPVAIVSPPGETNRLFIVEREGRIQVITNLVNPTKTLFLDITGPVDPTGEGGLLGLAFHPGYQTNRFFYVFYTLTTTTAQGTGFHDRVARFEISASNPNQALPNSQLSLITQIDEASNHNAGDLHFGPDGYLYVSLGDEGDGGDSFNNSKFITKDFFCAILRIDVDHRSGSLAPNPHPASSSNYAIPPDNPFIGATSFNGSAVNPNEVRTEFWAVGLRNPFRFSFDPVTGRLYCGDVGQGLWEEIDVIVKGGNYGWNYREGTHFYSGSPPSGVTFVEPILDYVHGGGSLEGNCVIGGVVYRGSGMPQLFGEYVFGDNVSGNIWALHYDGVSVSNFRRLTSLGSVSAFGTDPANQDILMVPVSGGASIYRLVYTSDSGTPLPSTLAETGAFASLATLLPEPGIVAYDLNVPFWSDHARKTRWFSVPNINDVMSFNSNGNWSFPTGTVWIKHFELELTNGVPQSARRLETRFLVRNSGGMYGITYRWDNSQANAFLVPEDGLDEPFVIHDGGTTRTQVWHYPSRSECLTCHTRAGGLALGFNTAQLHRNHDYGGTITNQILALSQAGYFQTPVTGTAALPALSALTNNNFSLEHRARSFLAANCSQCHQPGGSAQGSWDARFVTPLSVAGIVNGSLHDNLGNPNNRVLKPDSPVDSMLLTRLASFGPRHMPPLATSELNTEAISLLSQWITNTAFIVGRRVLYNNSHFDGNDPNPGPADDGAIATDKAALLPGRAAGFVNYGSYSRGLNGLVLDITDLPGLPSAPDFIFRAGNDANPGAWAPAPAPASFSVRPGAGTDGSDRVTILWLDNVIQKQWLQVTVEPTANTGLGALDVFCFGNAIGESGNSSTNALVNATDEILARNNTRPLNGAPVDFPYDYNRDSKVNATDQIIARNNTASSTTALQFITTPASTEWYLSGGGSALSPAAIARPIRIQSVRWTPRESAKVRFQVLSGRRYRLEGTETLTGQPWRPVAAQAVSTERVGEFEFWTLEPQNPGGMFYRIASD